MEPAQLLATINERHGLTLSLGDRYERGEHGAFRVRDETGEEFVLKWSLGTDASERIRRTHLATDHLADKGYPTPRYVVHGVSNDVVYSLQTALPGRPLGVVTLQHLPRLLELNALQRGPTPLPASDWPNMIVESVMFGFDSYCVVSSLYDYSDTTRDLLQQIQALVSHQSSTARVYDDIVHFDFNPVNILADNRHISGVVDWDGATTGDRSFDIVTLLFYAGPNPPVRDALWQHLSDNATLDEIALYLGHLIIRQLDWTIRHYDADAIEHSIRTAKRAHDELMSRL